jgi:hypothetical protein
VLGLSRRSRTVHPRIGASGPFRWPRVVGTRCQTRTDNKRFVVSRDRPFHQPGLALTRNCDIPTSALTGQRSSSELRKQELRRRRAEGVPPPAKKWAVQGSNLSCPETAGLQPAEPPLVLPTRENGRWHTRPIENDLRRLCLLLLPRLRRVGSPITHEYDRVSSSEEHRHVAWTSQVYALPEAGTPGIEPGQEVLETSVAPSRTPLMNFPLQRGSHQLGWRVPGVPACGCG